MRDSARPGIGHTAGQRSLVPREQARGFRIDPSVDARVHSRDRRRRDGQQRFVDEAVSALLIARQSEIGARVARGGQRCWAQQQPQQQKQPQQSKWKPENPEEVRADQRENTTVHTRQAPVPGIEPRRCLL
ncbi:unnamed protein product [Lampetra fluviatilis]